MRLSVRRCVDRRQCKCTGCRTGFDCSHYLILPKGQEFSRRFGKRHRTVNRYDNNGNLIKQVADSGGDEIDYTCDFRNRLTSVTDKSNGQITQVVTYVYDAFNNLVGETVTPYTNGNPGTPVTSHFVFDPESGNMVLDLTNSGAVNERML